ncbi:hypothetical protein FOXG_15164 [Fusarium oxysporum f. sp. lycopersici 4287]|uniref:Uncharacterized protein n=2 Tax=Fusarium oxysporum TaxID=5507 RepID=A0A0J9W4B4_FUSO4|nr:hypothetical protein FOXG_14316 [Fusarium oxysporum f. sp. lycopersici 4287]XP_018255748.1 hypothetical protein FOXG_15164 [Fusarium oxysporum f. sp. lycopersici 4287]KNB16458.1 hypothetical protein FOXG_14316 [Fusarium oxysporum f. sp. lycopersici 4287]KNB17703.1 hypothetical protein FOXG_15164 [Fusarium oxysporum f. sp. lycopersici 4287]
MTIEIQVDKPPDDAASLNLHLDQPQPSGNEFTESLKAALTSLKPQIERLEQLLTSINDEHRGLGAVRRSLYSSKDKLAKDLEKAQECLIDVEESTATEEEIVRDLEGVYKKHPGDNKLRAFLDERKKTVIEYQKVYIIVNSQLRKSSAELSKTESEIQSVNRWLDQLEAERAEVMKEKEGAYKAMKSPMFMSQFMERGWQASVDRFGQAFGDEADIVT